MAQANGQQPVKQLASLQAIPHLVVIRPGDANETAVAWCVALEKRDRPVLPDALEDAVY
jgi:transketolase